MVPLHSSRIALAALLGYLVSVKLFIVAFPAAFASTQQARVFDWPFLGACCALAVAGDALSRRTGFPAVNDEAIPRWSRFGMPSLLGLGLGVWAVLNDVATGWAAQVAARLHILSIHIPLPAAALIYPGGGIFTDIVLRLFPLPLVVWLVSNLLLRGRGQAQTFWIAASITSLAESTAFFTEPGSQTLVGAWLAFSDWALNFAQAAVFRRSGFLACVLVRFWFYVVWHIVWGGLLG